MKYTLVTAILAFTFIGCGSSAAPSGISDSSAVPAPALNEPSLEEKQQKSTFIIETTVDSFDIPRSNVMVDFYDTRAALDPITCAAQLYTKEEYKDMEIPDNAVAACGGWYAGGGDYYYIVPTAGGIAIYKGWQDELQEDAGYHWEKFKEIN